MTPSPPVDAETAGDVVPPAVTKNKWCNACQMNPADGCRHPLGSDQDQLRGGVDGATIRMSAP